MRARLDLEQQFIDARGGPVWIATYVKPFYMGWMGIGPNENKLRKQARAVRTRAHRLSIEDIGAMASMQWRVQVMGAWYAIARLDSALSRPVHLGFDHCYGTLTAPALTAAVLTYQGPDTGDVLRRYRERDIARQFGAAGIVTAALRRLGEEPQLAEPDRDDTALDNLMKTAERLQRRGWSLHRSRS